MNSSIYVTSVLLAFSYGGGEEFPRGGGGGLKGGGKPGEDTQGQQP